MIAVTVFLSTLNQMEFNLVQNRKENSHHDYIPLNLKGKYYFVERTVLMRTKSSKLKSAVEIMKNPIS